MYKNIVILLRNNSKIKTAQARNFARSLAAGEHLTTLNQDTLTGRILLYLNTDKNAKRGLPLPLNSAQNVNDLEKLDVDGLVRILESLGNEQNRSKFSKVFERIDDECFFRASRLKQLSFTDIFKILNSYMGIVSHHITGYKFYNYSTDYLYSSKERLTKIELLQLIFYIGLQKRTLKAQAILRKCTSSMDGDFIKNLTVEELCIVCNANFKTSTKISNTLFLEEVKHCLAKNLQVYKDAALFTTLIKTVRHNRTQDDDLLSTISCVIFFNKLINEYSFSTICHIFALFADHAYYDKSVVEIFTKTCLKQLSESKFVAKTVYLTEQLRGKDIQRLLWCLATYSYLNVIDKSDIEQIVIPKLIERIEAGEFSNDLDSLLNITLYLWMLNYQAKELVPYYLNEENVRIIRGRKTKSKERLNLLLYCMANEDRVYFNKLNLKILSAPPFSPDYQINQREALRRVLSALDSILDETDIERLNIQRFKITQEVPYINILGITGYDKMSKAVVYIEILDEYTCLKNMDSYTPKGLMALKLRMLNCRKQGVVEVPQFHIKIETEEELGQYLADAINLVC